MQYDKRYPSGFTGTLTDSLGRKVTYQNGKRVKGQQEQTKPAAKKPVNFKHAVKHIAAGAVKAAKQTKDPAKLKSIAKSLGSHLRNALRQQVTDYISTLHAEYKEWIDSNKGKEVVKIVDDALTQQLENAKHYANKFYEAYRDRDTEDLREELRDLNLNMYDFLEEAYDEAKRESEDAYDAISDILSEAEEYNGDPDSMDEEVKEDIRERAKPTGWKIVLVNDAQYPHFDIAADVERVQESMNLPKDFTGLAPPDAAGRRYYYVKGVRQEKTPDQKVKDEGKKWLDDTEKSRSASQVPVSKLEGVTGKPQDIKPVEPTPEEKKLADPSITPQGGKLKFSPKFHFNKSQREYLGKTLGGVSTWKLRKVTEKDVKALDDLAKQVTDPLQWRAINSVANKVDNAAQVGGYAYIPVGKITQKSGKVTVSDTTPQPAPGKRGVENTEPVHPSNVGHEGPAKPTFSITSHKSPKVKKTDRKRSKGETTYANIIHNQTGTPTSEEWSALSKDLPRLNRDQVNRLYRRFKIDKVGTGHTLKQLRKGIQDHIADITEQGAGEEKIPAELGKDKRAGKHSKNDYTHFRPIKKI